MKRHVQTVRHPPQRLVRRHHLHQSVIWCWGCMLISNMSDPFGHLGQFVEAQRAALLESLCIQATRGPGALPVSQW